jgi:hypothetical protein
MKFVCVQNCQVRVNGIAVPYMVGAIEEFNSCPNGFEPVAELKEVNGLINFDALSPNELRVADGIEKEAIKKFVKAKYPEIKITYRSTAESILNDYLYVRERVYSFTKDDAFDREQTNPFEQKISVEPADDGLDALDEGTADGDEGTADGDEGTADGDDLLDDVETTE